MAKINLPRYPWFISRLEGKYVTNTYSGSLGTSPERGALANLAFHYRAYVDISSGEQDTFSLVAESYLVKPWREGGNKTNEEQAKFEASENGIAQASEWLCEVAAKYGF